MATRTKAARKTTGREAAKRCDLPPLLDQAISLEEIATAWGISKRKAEQMKANGELPPPDKMVGSLPRWYVSTINAHGREAK